MFVETYILNILSKFPECGTFLKLSQEIGTTQPSITRAMKKLEDELGLPLFDRTKNSIVLNENGRIASQYAIRIMDLQNQMISTLQKNKIVRIVSMGIMPAQMYKEELLSTNPDLNIKYEIVETEEEVMTALEKNANYGICTRKIMNNDFKSRLFITEKLSVLLPENHKLAQKKSVYLKDLAGETMIQRKNVGFWEKVKREKIPGAKFIRQEEKEAVNTLVENSTIPTFISNLTTDFSIPEGKIAVPIFDEEMTATFWIVERK